MPQADSPPANPGKTGYAQQAAVRVGIGLFMGIYFSLTEYITHPLYLAFVVYALGSYVLAKSSWQRRFSTCYLAATLLLDVSFTLLSLYVVEAYGYFLFLILIQICFGYGVRYGSSVLWAATFVVCSGILVLFVVSDYWAARPYEAISFFVGVPFLALYIHYLNKQLRNAKHRADTQAATNSRLLRFVSHDMRTQLQALLYTTATMRQADTDPGVANAVDTIEETVHSLARISSSFVRRPEPQKRAGTIPTDSLSPGAHFGLGRWLGRLCGRFDALLRERNITLHVHFAAAVPIALTTDRIALERLLLNSISNAARFSSEGSIEIALESEQHVSTGDSLVIRIRNRSPYGFRARVQEEAGSAGAQWFFGAGLGLSINEDIAASIGGTFAVEATAADSFSCVLTLPGSNLAEVTPEPLASPIYCCSRNVATVRTVRSLLATTCNVFGDFRAKAALAATASESGGPATSILDDAAVATWMNQAGEHEARTSAARGCMVVLAEPPIRREPAPARTYATAALAAFSLENAVDFASAFNARDQSLVATIGGYEQIQVSFSGLYVEDGEFNAKRLIAEAEGAGWCLEHAADVHDAGLKLQTHEYDFVLMDWELGDATALEVLDGLACRAPSFETPVFILSAHRKAEIEGLLEHRSVRAVLEKPLSAAAIMRQVAQHLGAMNDEPRAIHPLPDPVTDIFQSETYEALLKDVETYAHTASLLDAFCGEIESLVAAITAPNPTTDTATGRLLHKLAGTAGAGGGIYLANVAEDMFKTLGGAAQAQPLDRTRLHATWLITRRHIEIFRGTLPMEAYSPPDQY